MLIRQCCFSMNILKVKRKLKLFNMLTLIIKAHQQMSHITLIELKHQYFSNVERPTKESESEKKDGKD